MSCKYNQSLTVIFNCLYLENEKGPGILYLGKTLLIGFLTPALSSITFTAHYHLQDSIVSLMTTLFTPAS